MLEASAAKTRRRYRARQLELSPRRTRCIVRRQSQAEDEFICDMTSGSAENVSFLIRCVALTASIALLATASIALDLSTAFLISCVGCQVKSLLHQLTSRWTCRGDGLSSQQPSSSSSSTAFSSEHGLPTINKDNFFQQLGQRHNQHKQYYRRFQYNRDNQHN